MSNPTVRITSASPNLNEFADYILSNETSLIDSAENFELISKSHVILGSGEDSIVEVIFTFQEISERETLIVKYLVELADKLGIEIHVEISSD